MSEKLNDELAAIMAKETDIQKQVQAYHRKLMSPIWEERRELAKQIPNFWSDTISRAPMFSLSQKEEDLEALENLEDFHVEYDENRPDYRKVVAHFKKNDLFKNESLSKEFTVDEDKGTVISKTAIEYHSGKEPNNKRKADEIDEDDELDMNFLQWFGDETLPTGIVLTEDIFPAAIEYYQGDSDNEEEDDDEIELGSDSDEDEEAPKKKAKK